LNGTPAPDLSETHDGHVAEFVTKPAHFEILKLRQLSTAAD
jgi:hypothetical protein